MVVVQVATSAALDLMALVEELVPEGPEVQEQEPEVQEEPLVA